MAGNKSIFNRLEDVLGINSGEKRVNQYSFNSEDIIVKTNNEEEYKRQKLENLQQDFLKKQWIKTGIESAYRGADGINYIKSMYQDADLMDQYPEIASALNTFMDEVCTLSNSGRVLNIYSNSERIKNILEDLFINKLQINVTLPLIVRTLCKYGNDYHLLNIDKDKGLLLIRIIIDSGGFFFVQSRRQEGRIKMEAGCQAFHLFAGWIQQMHP